jgi:hypothetical protein
MRSRLSGLAERVARGFLAGEDWVVTDEIKLLASSVAREIRRRGGTVETIHDGRLRVRSFYVDEDHSIPLEIQLYEGTYYPGKVLINARFSGQHPIPVKDRTPFDAKAVVDAVADGFMSLVNYRQASVRRVAGSSYPSMAEVEKAELWDLVYWNRYLPGPGSAAMGTSRFEQELDKEARIIRRIVDRIKELGGITPEVSRAVGWDR